MNIGRWKISNRILLLWIVIFGILLRLYFEVGVIGSGDFPHIVYSYKASVGDLSLSIGDPQTSARVGFVYPVALFYRLLGVSEFSAYLFSLIISLASILLIYHLGKLFFNKKIGLMAAFLLSFFPLNVNYATQAYPDLAQAFFTGLAVYFFFLGEKGSKQFYQALWYLLTGLSIGVSVLTKESGIIAFFFLGVFVFYKLIFRKERIRASYVLVFVGFAATVVFQLIHNFVVSGDMLLRYHMIDRVYYGAIGNLYNYTGFKLIERLFIHVPYLMLTNVNFGFFTVFLLMALVYVAVFRRKEATAVSLWFITLFLYLNFGSTSLTSYVLLPGGTPRYLEMLTFPGLLLIAFFISEEGPLVRKCIAPFAVVFLLLTSVAFIHLNPDRHALDAERELSAFIGTLDKKPVYADAGTQAAISFFTGYKRDIRSFWKTNYPETGSTELVRAENIEGAYVIVNKEYFGRIPENYKAARPGIYYNVPKDWVFIKHIGEKEGGIQVYYAP